MRKSPKVGDLITPRKNDCVDPTNWGIYTVIDVKVVREQYGSYEVVRCITPQGKIAHWFRPNKFVHYEASKKNKLFS